MIEVFADEVNFSNLSLDDDEKHFHAIIGQIEDILMEDRFIQVHNNFMDKYWKEFEDTDENKLIYMEIFKEYISTIEKYLEEELRSRITNFDMEQFEIELEQRKCDLDGEIFDLLETFSDFTAFKAMFIDYKNMKEGKTIDFSSDFCVSKYIVQETAM